MRNDADNQQEGREKLIQEGMAAWPPPIPPCPNDPVPPKPTPQPGPVDSGPSEAPAPPPVDE
jgi:hypothetical protein